jgi:hypothetical protein
MQSLVSPKDNSAKGKHASRNANHIEIRPSLDLLLYLTNPVKPNPWLYNNRMNSAQG